MLVTNDLITHGSWPMRLVDNCEIAEDGLVRTIIIRTKGGVKKGM